jgi:hypothetical protein
VIGRLAVICSLLGDGMVFATMAEALASMYSVEHPHAIPAWGFGVIALAGFYVPRFLEQYEIGPRAAYALTGFIGLLLIYVVVRIGIAGDVAVWDFGWVADFFRHAQRTVDNGGHAIAGGTLLLLTWARTSYRSSDDVEMEGISRGVAVPFAVVTILVVLGAQADRSGEIARVGVAFYTFAILSLALSQLALSGATFGDMRAGSTAGTLLAGVAVVAVVGLLIIGLLTTVFGPYVGPVIASATQWVLTIALTPFAFVLTKLFEALFQGNNPFPNLDRTTINNTRQAANPGSTHESQAHEVSMFMLRIIALVLMTAIAALFVTIFVRLRKRRHSLLEDDRVTSTTGDFRSDVGDFLRGLFRRKPSRAPLQASTETTRLYLEVLERAESSGAVKAEGETASEFAPALTERFASPVTDDITRAFETARYGAREPDARQLEDLRRRWREVT